jgi:hypothetical protein
MHDGVALSHLILAHLPSATPYFTGLHMFPSSRENQLENSKSLAEALEYVYGVNLINSKFILNGSQLDFIFLLLFLYQTLPLFSPRGVIEFTSQLHQTVTKTIEINNPTTRTIVYNIDIIGGAEFTVTEKQITLLPKSQQNITVEFKSRFNHDVSSLLIVKVNKMALNLASIFTYTLNGRVESSGIIISNFKKFIKKYSR